MTQPRKKDEEPAEATSGAKAETAPSNPADPKKPAGLNYVFKIAPADPKNSFDFEDVADK
jgi:hypothetical protein